MLPSSRNFRQKRRWITGHEPLKHFIKHVGTVMKHSPASSPWVTIRSDSAGKRRHGNVTREEIDVTNQAGIEPRQATGARQPLPRDRPGRYRRRPSPHCQEEEAGTENHFAPRCLIKARAPAAAKAYAGTEG